MTEDEEYEANEENINYKAISCEQIPEHFLDKLIAKKHFGKYGKITRFILTPKRLSCTVEYETEDQAERAYLDGGNFNGIEFCVNFAENKVAHVQDTEQWVDPDVQAELDAMSPGHRSASRPGYVGSSALPRALPKNLTALPVVVKPMAAAGRNDVATIATTPATKPVSAAVRAELEAVLRKPALTDEEKYRILEARDKLIRLKTVRQTDIKKAVATKGNCPDMCPEKERLMREFQRQVSIFEMADDDEDTPSTISHRKAIKEYSRSSADQEVPLAHELRSESVLQMTMLYLMHRIMDLCDDPETSLGDWFHFVWDRTRSIRKDITQQELCSFGGVQLVEQCARFHIHCAARLVAEDPSVFDKKINAENLTKCLQTLKYMYHDLRIKGVQCPSEGEFRSYIILLNLGDSNFLWELKQLPESIQTSREIMTAIAFYNALQNNNYVKFFAMVKSHDTSYLSACILLGYFNKLRVRAMEVIIKSHSRGRIEVHLPLSYIGEILGFEDEVAAVSFLSYHGLQCDEMDDRVYLDRMARPSLEYAMDRALKLVESKRLVSVGECIFGQPLPSASLFERHQPHSSFDSNGVLRLESWTAQDQLRGQQGLPLPSATTVNPPDSSIFKAPESNIFKMPQATNPLISLKQQQHKQNQSQKSLFGSIDDQKERYLQNSEQGGFQFGDKTTQDASSLASQGGFKFGGNIFGGNTNAASSSSSIFQVPAAVPIEPQKGYNAFQEGSIFRKHSENATPPPPKTTNIFGAFVAPNETKTPLANSTSIFSSAVKETANIFQQQPQPNQLPTDPFHKDNVFQNFQTKHEAAIFAGFPTSLSSSTTSTQALTNLKVSSSASLHDMEQRRLQLEREHELKQKQLEEEKRKLKELEERRLKERQLQEEQKLKNLENKRKEELKVKCLKKAAEEQESILNSIIMHEVEILAKEEFQKYFLLAEASELQRDLILKEEVLALVEDIAIEEYAAMCYDQMLLNRYFNLWLQHSRRKRVQRKLIEGTPIWVTAESRADFALALEHPCKSKNLEMIRRYRFGHPCDFKQLMQLGKHSGQANEQKPPLCLFSLVGRHLAGKINFTPSGLLQQRQYFKFLISLPSDKEEVPGFETYCEKWLFKNIKKAQMETGPFVHGLEQHMALCVRKLTGIYPKNEQGDEMKTEGDHSDGLIYFFSSDQYPEQARRRLYNILYLSTNFKKLPVAIIAYNCRMNKEEITEMLSLDFLEEEGLLFSYKIFGNETGRKDFSMYKAVKEALNYITIESYRDNNLDIQSMAMENILTFLESTLGEETWRRWQHSAQNNPVFHKICQQPKYVLGIYLMALQQLMQISQEDFMEKPEFPEELKEFVPQLQNTTDIALGLEFFPTNWKASKTQKLIKNFLEELSTLPQVKNIISFANVEEVEMWILDYATKCLPSEDIAIKVAHAAIKDLIRQLKAPIMETIPLEERLKFVSYLTVLKPIIFAHINNILQQFHETLKDAGVIYIIDALTTYKTQPWWLNYQPLDLVKMDYTQEDEEEPAESKDPNDSTKENEKITNEQIEDIITNAEKTCQKVEMNLLAINQISPKRKTLALSRSTETLTLKRSLDESLYKFELSKKIGQYDTSYIDSLTQDIDNSIHEVLSAKNKSSSPPENVKKRKLLNSNGNAIVKEVDDVIAHAMDLIEKVESMEDEMEKIKYSIKMHLSS